MNPMELTVDQVRVELESLINKYPDRNGRVDASYGFSDTYCVYFTDENGCPVSLTHFENPEQCRLVTPVCIVGQWIEDYHPVFKQDEVISRILHENSTLANMDEEVVPFQREVWLLLAEAQSTQDSEGAHWVDIELVIDFAEKW